MVATTNDALAPVTLARRRAGETRARREAGARTPDELARLRGPAASAGVVVQVGFNHRFHPALQQAHALYRDGAIGRLLYIRARYGHGGRLGYEREWRADPEIAGGGELLDQGIHLIDLARWFAGDFMDVRGHAATFFWDMPVEDNGFLQLTTEGGQVAWLHASCTEWKNLFSFEVFGRDRQAAGGRARRQLRAGATDILPHAAGDGPTGDHHLRVPAARTPPGGRSIATCSPASVRAAGPTATPRRRGRRTAHRPPRVRQGRRAMIITRSPLRISLGGGGTDLPSYYREHGGFLIAAAIDKYVYITLHQTFVHELIVKYSKLERVASAERADAPHHPRGHAAAGTSTAATWRLPAWPTSPPAPAWAPRAASPPPC